MMRILLLLIDQCLKGVTSAATRSQFIRNQKAAWSHQYKQSLISILSQSQLQVDTSNKLVCVLCWFMSDKNNITQLTIMPLTRKHKKHMVVTQPTWIAKDSKLTLKNENKGARKIKSEKHIPPVASYVALLIPQGTAATLRRACMMTTTERHKHSGDQTCEFRKLINMQIIQ